METKRTKVYSYSINTMWGDMDAFGHVNNARYMTYCEEGRVQWLQQILKDAEFGTRGWERDTACVVVKTSCTFKKAVVYPARLDIDLFIGEPGRSSFMMYFVMTVDGEVYAEADAKVVWVNFAENKSTELPELIRNLMTE